MPKIYELFLINSPISPSILPLRYRKSNVNIPLQEVRCPNYSAIPISLLGKEIKSDVANFPDTKFTQTNISGRKCANWHGYFQFKASSAFLPIIYFHRLNTFYVDIVLACYWRVCWPLLCLCSLFMSVEGCLDSNPECCRATNLATHLSLFGYPSLYNLVT